MEKVKNNKLVWLGALIFAFTFMLSALIMPARASREVNADFTGNSLVGTTWLFNNHIDTPGGAIGNVVFQVSFTSNGDSYSSLCYAGGADHWKYDNTNVYYTESSSGWLNQAYRTIQITGGTDAVDGGAHFEALRAWLNNEATLQSGGGSGGGDPATGVVEDTIAIALFAVIAAGATTVVVLNKKTKENR